MVLVNEFFPDIAFHPGCTLEEKLEELEMEAGEFAYRTGLDESVVRSVLRCESPISLEMSIRFEEVLGIPAHFWRRSQASYDSFTAGKQETAEEAGIFSLEMAFA